jgi:predicted transcriptional regulator
MIVKGTSPKYKVSAVTVRLRDEDLEALKRITKSTGIKRQTFMAEAIRDGIAVASKILCEEEGTCKKNKQEP